MRINGYADPTLIRKTLEGTSDVLVNAKSVTNDISAYREDASICTYAVPAFQLIR